MLIHNQNFNIRQIAESGQCFRMNPLEDKEGSERYSLIAYGRYLELQQIREDVVELSCSEEEYEQIWEDYFDLKYDYSKVIDHIYQSDDAFLIKAAEYGKGIRILRQEPFEAAISFIISQNKNIPAIKSCIERICEFYGDKKEDMFTRQTYYTFPSAKVLAEAVREDLRALKTGYRDSYIINASQAVVSGTLDLESLREHSFEEAVKVLKNIHGIGDKVANCIALYGLHHIDGFPVDVWISRVLTEIYHNQFDKEEFKEYAGIIQQYMFYYMRHLYGIS